jgi:hypothetical protein
MAVFMLPVHLFPLIFKGVTVYGVNSEFVTSVDSSGDRIWNLNFCNHIQTVIDEQSVLCLQKQGGGTATSTG